MTDFNNLLERVEWLIGQKGMTKSRFAKEIGLDLFMVAFFLNNAILRPLLSELRKILHGQFGHRLHACADITLGHDSGAVARQTRYEQKVTAAQIQIRAK